MSEADATFRLFAAGRVDSIALGFIKDLIIVNIIHTKYALFESNGDIELYFHCGKLYYCILYQAVRQDFSSVTRVRSVFWMCGPATDTGIVRMHLTKMVVVSKSCVPCV